MKQCGHTPSCSWNKCTSEITTHWDNHEEYTRNIGETAAQTEKKKAFSPLKTSYNHFDHVTAFTALFQILQSLCNTMKQYIIMAELMHIQQNCSMWEEFAFKHFWPQLFLKHFPFLSLFWQRGLKTNFSQHPNCTGDHTWQGSGGQTWAKRDT